MSSPPCLQQKDGNDSLVPHPAKNCVYLSLRANAILWQQVEPHKMLGKFLGKSPEHALCHLALELDKEQKATGAGGRLIIAHLS